MFNDKKSNGQEALLEAQKIAFAPIIFQCARLLRDYGIFELLQKNKKTGLSIEEITDKIDITTYAAQILCESGYSMSALDLRDEKYYITTIGYFLQTDEMTRVNMDFNHDVNYQGLFFLDEALKEQRPAGLHEIFSKEKTIYPILSELPQKAKTSWFNFDHFYSDATFKKLVDIMSKKDIKTLLDIGGNTGKWAIGLTSASKDTIVTILDHQGQIDVALKNAKKAGVKDRVLGKAMDLLDHTIAFPKGVDAVWMSQFLDCFGPNDIVNLIRRSGEALDENGRVYIVEPFWDKSNKIGSYCLINTSPYFTALANGTSKMYRASEMENFVNKAGLEVESQINDLGFNSTLMVCKKP
ncbi:MAG: SAM-dependent methyltransferase [Sulfurimonas sp.]|nr:SAM-dependent methyltransferase [Sulfurimonas sp.]